MLEGGKMTLSFCPPVSLNTLQGEGMLSKSEMGKNRDTMKGRREEKGLHSPFGYLLF